MAKGKMTSREEVIIVSVVVIKFLIITNINKFTFTEYLLIARHFQNGVIYLNSIVTRIL